MQRELLMQNNCITIVVEIMFECNSYYDHSYSISEDSAINKSTTLPYATVSNECRYRPNCTCVIQYGDFVPEIQMSLPCDIPNCFKRYKLLLMP